MVIKRVTYLGVLLATAAVLTAGARAQAGTKKRSLRIVLVDVDKVLQEYKKGNDCYAQIRKELEPLIRSLREQARDINDEKRRLLANPRTDPVEFLKKKQALELKLAKIKRDEKTFLDKKTKKEIEAMMEVWNDAIAAVSKYAKENGIDLVLKQQVRTSKPRLKATFYRNVAARTVLYAAAHLDITDKIVKQLNADYERGRNKAKG
jgi:Skp family chaperone for outer membrane proteins